MINMQKKEFLKENKTCKKWKLKLYVKEKEERRKIDKIILLYIIFMFFLYS